MHEPRDSSHDEKPLCQRLPHPPVDSKYNTLPPSRQKYTKDGIAHLPCARWLQKLHCRIYRFTRHPEETQDRNSNERNSAPNTSHPHLRQRPATATGLSRSTGSGGALGGASGAGGGVGERQQARVDEGEATGRSGYPNDLQPWKPPLLFQFCKVSLAGVDILARMCGCVRVTVVTCTYGGMYVCALRSYFLSAFSETRLLTAFGT